MKYRNRKVELDGHIFDSRKEAQRYAELKLLQKAGRISELQIQVPFQLLPAQKEEGKVVERAVKYIADFTYWENGRFVVEDAKGMRTEVYKLKKKMMRYFNGITIREV